MIHTIYDLLMVAAIVFCLLTARRAWAHSTKTCEFTTQLALLLRGQQNTTEYLLEVTSKQRQRIEQLEAITHELKKP